MLIAVLSLFWYKQIDLQVKGIENFVSMKFVFHVLSHGHAMLENESFFLSSLRRLGVLTNLSMH
jgi:hypothetical protein